MNKFGFGLPWVTYGLRVKHFGLPPGGFIPPVIQIQKQNQRQVIITSIRLCLDGNETNRGKRAADALDFPRPGANVKEPRVIRAVKIDGFGLKPWVKMVVNNGFPLVIKNLIESMKPKTGIFTLFSRVSRSFTMALLITFFILFLENVIQGAG